jgi:hypothetical protein
MLKILLTRRNNALKFSFSTKHLIEQSYLKTAKYSVFRRWSNFQLRTIPFSDAKASININRSIFPKTVMLTKTLNNFLKGKIFRIVKLKLLLLKPIEDSKKIDFYININQVFQV